MKSGELTVGDTAPPVTVAAWLKGNPIDDFQEDHIYVIEFWGTVCPPCRTSMPHLSRLQEHYGAQVSFIGICPESAQVVGSFLDSEQDRETGVTWDEVVKYRIAIDPQRETHSAYMEAAGQTGIPVAFVVGRDGHIEWIGHPMSIDKPLERIVADTWDREAARREFVERQAAKKAFADMAGPLREAQRSKDWGRAIALLDEFLVDFPSQTNLYNANLDFVKFKIQLRAKLFEDALTLADELASKHWEDGPRLNNIAWVLVTEVPKTHQDLDLALRLAERASALFGHSDGTTLDTVARVYYERRNLEQAIAWQRRAVEHAANDKGIREVLQKYEAGRKE